MRHRLWLSAGTQVKVGSSPSLPAGTAVTLHSADCGSDSVEVIVVEGGQNLVVGSLVDY